MNLKRVLPSLFVSFVALTIASPGFSAEYAVDSSHSSAIFKVKHLETSNFYGAFKNLEGALTFDPANLSAASINFTIQAESVDSRNEQRDGHIKSPDFLNAKQFPTITFKSSSVKAISGDTYEVAGNLTLLGVSKPITAKVTKTGQGVHPRSKKDIIGFEAIFEVDRTDHGMSFMAGPLSKEIGFILSIEAVKQ